MNAHDELIASGYEHIHHNEVLEDNGDAEHGPRIYWVPAYDEYIDSDCRICIGAGLPMSIDVRDHLLEAWEKYNGEGTV